MGIGSRITCSGRMSQLRTGAPQAARPFSMMERASRSKCSSSIVIYETVTPFPISQEMGMNSMKPEFINGFTILINPALPQTTLSLRWSLCILKLRENRFIHVFRHLPLNTAVKLPASTRVCSDTATDPNQTLSCSSHEQSKPMVDVNVNRCSSPHSCCIVDRDTLKSLKCLDTLVNLSSVGYQVRLTQFNHSAIASWHILAQSTQAPSPSGHVSCAS